MWQEHTYTHTPPHTPLQNPDTEQNPNSKKSIPTHITVKLKTKDKEKSCESSKKAMAFYLQRKIYLNDSGFLMRNPSRGHRGATEHSSSVEKEKELSIQNTIFRENSSVTKRKSRHFQIKENQIYPHLKKTKTKKLKKALQTERQ